MKGIAKRFWPPLLIVFVLATIGVGVWHYSQRQAQKKRQAGYQLAVRSYSRALKPGMTRKEVENYLRTKNEAFQQTCCVDPKETRVRSSWDDLLKIGEEDTPWYCSENNVYVAFQFADHERRHDYAIRDDDLDTLRAVTLYQTLEGCL
jgi:hypothetical protein